MIPARSALAGKRIQRYITRIQSRPVACLSRVKDRLKIERRWPRLKERKG